MGLPHIYANYSNFRRNSKWWIMKFKQMWKLGCLYNGPMSIWATPSTFMGRLIWARRPAQFKSKFKVTKKDTSKISLSLIYPIKISFFVSMQKERQKFHRRTSFKLVFSIQHRLYRQPNIIIDGFQTECT